MKRINLIKPVDHGQIGHLYEHLFCAALYRYLRQNNLYAYLDYDLEARAYYSGLVEVQLRLFSPASISEVENIKALEINVDEDEINGCLIQILAEKGVDVASLDKDIILKKLHAYQVTSWQDYDELAVENAAKHLRTRKGLTLKHRSPRQFLVLRQDMELEREFANSNKLVYWPAFFVLSGFITMNLEDAIPYHTYAYSYHSYRVYTTGSVKETNLYRVDRRQATLLTTEADVVKEFIQEILTNGTFQRLISDLQNVDNTVDSQAPNAASLYSSTAMLVGAKGWKSIGTEENLRGVLEHSTIRFTLGKSREELDLGKLS